MRRSCPPTQAPTHRGWLLLTGLVCLLGLLTCWSWQKWDSVWVQRAQQFFPPEWQANQDTEQLAWQYPIYRSNDSYQWVHLADALASGDSSVLQHRYDEGPQSGRSNAWHSGLARLLHRTGAAYAWAQQWPVQRGIHAIAHWLGAVIKLLTLALGARLIFQLAGAPAMLWFGLLYYFNAAIDWDFSFSRLDHDAVFHPFFLLQIIGVFGILTAPRKTQWALCAAIGSAGCWWIGATIQAAIGAIAALAYLLAALKNEDSPEVKEAHTRACWLWGGSAAALILMLCLLEQRSPFDRSIASLHPIFALTQWGACTLCAGATMPPGRRKKLWLATGLICGLAPLIWIGIYQPAAHPWLDPLVRRIHIYITEFQSPFANGAWRQGIALQAFAVAALAIPTLNWRQPQGRFWLILTLGLVALSLLQTRWIGLLAVCASGGLVLSQNSEAPRWRQRALIACALLTVMGWLWKWNRIETHPGRVFVADMILQVGARDLSLNLNHYSDGSPARVAVPYAFAATSALFEQVNPLGTLYWENRAGIAASSALFASADDAAAYAILNEAGIEYIAVQPLQLGQPFAQMVTWTALASTEPEVLKSSLAWRLAYATQLPTWCEALTFYGSFDPSRFSISIYRIRPKPE